MACWSELTPEQQDCFGNGCGSVRGWIDPPELIFEANCRQHDFYYTRGGGLREKLWADMWFGWLMLRNACAQRGLVRPLIYTPLALIYALAVLLGGWCAFRWGTQLRTSEDVIAAWNRHSRR